MQVKYNFQSLTANATGIVVYTDGSSRGNPGMGGAGIVLKSGPFRKEISIPLGNVTNNIAELTAIKAALETIKRRDCPILLHTDSEYALGVLTGQYRAKKNRELIGEIKNLMEQFPQLQFCKVEGHAGIEENERADYLACLAADKGEFSETSVKVEENGCKTR